jgi:hypothetical protein
VRAATTGPATRDRNGAPVTGAPAQRSGAQSRERRALVPFAPAMGVVVATTVGLIIWLVLWALGQKAVDAFMITVLIALVAATLRMLSPYMPGNRR